MEERERREESPDLERHLSSCLKVKCSSLHRHDVNEEEEEDEDVFLNLVDVPLSLSVIIISLFVPLLFSLSPILDFHSSLLSLCFVFKSIFHPSSLLSTHSIPPM